MSPALVFVTLAAGGLTTVSTFSVETIQLMTHGRWVLAALNVGSNLVVGFGACVAGFLAFIA